MIKAEREKLRFIIVCFEQGTLVLNTALTYSARSELGVQIVEF